MLGEQTVTLVSRQSTVHRCMQDKVHKPEKMSFPLNMQAPKPHSTGRQPWHPRVLEHEAALWQLSAMPQRLAGQPVNSGATLQCLSSWLQKTPKGHFQSLTVMHTTVASRITCTHPRRMLLSTGALPPSKRWVWRGKKWEKPMAESSHGANLRCSGTLKYWMKWLTLLLWPPPLHSELHRFRQTNQQ